MGAMAMQGCGLKIALASMLAGLALGHCSAQVQDAAPQQAAAADGFKDVDALLDALETADRDLQSLTAGIKYDRTFEIQGDRQLRLGNLWYVADKPAEPAAAPIKKFAIRFDQLYIGPTKRTEDKTYIFDGQWLMEKDGVEKFYQKKQVVGPGEH